MNKCPLDPKYYDISSFKKIKARCINDHETDVWFSQKHCTGFCTVCESCFVLAIPNKGQKFLSGGHVATFLRAGISKLYDMYCKEKKGKYE